MSGKPSLKVKVRGRIVKKLGFSQWVWILLLLPHLANASSYAPLADFSALRQHAQCQLTAINESLLQSWTPPTDFFTVPAYPEAKLASALPSSTARIQGKEYQTFPSAVLLSTDTPQKIVSFYLNTLGRGWYELEDRGLLYIYRMPRPMTSGKDLTQHLLSRPGYTPHIAIDTDLTPCDKHLVQGARTRITVVASPR